MTQTQGSEPIVIALAPVIDRSAVVQHLDELRSAFGAGRPIEIGCGEVQQIGQAGLQLLASAVRTCRERDIAISFKDCRGIEPVIRLAGLADMFIDQTNSAGTSA
ncbi:lipid asymmetry maintenance protein MlaB [Rhizorhabdus sp.]|jgi:anti-anti-sigma regulatory factor|uniref:STAS domain-containing protein n=1 Tax=Rhizorhabdus sp. TaxID=1968843 RepID=UPI001B683D66|nr:STAS domain-containing protein [Rhizorhabdus sp.]MBP8233187.1 STAS domain-containing protein [Rhizorhabdus sp.]